MKQGKNKQQIVAIIGASGFVGRNLINHLLRTTNYYIKAVCRDPETITVDARHEDRLERVTADIFDAAAIEAALHGVDSAVYLIHMMAAKGDYAKLEAKCAHIFGKAAANQKISRVVYMSGLGNDKEKLSKHLKSRHHTGDILRSHLPLVIEMRASMIVGDGSIAYEIVKNLVKRLPLQTIPSWAVTMTQPIALHDAMLYLSAALTINVTHHEIVEIGGPEQLTYKDLIEKYAHFVGKNPTLVLVPIVPISLSGWWLNLFTPPRYAKVGREMAESLRNPMIVLSPRAKELFPNIQPVPIEQSFTR